MTPEERIAAKHLIAVWHQYGENCKTDADGRIYLTHANMTAGERAADWLVERGLAEDQGYGCYLTQAGMDLDEEEYP